MAGSLSERWRISLLAGKLMLSVSGSKAGLAFAYHNHDFEFVDYNGENGYNIIMRETDPALVKLQMDLYWIMHSSKLGPSDLFKKQPGRFVMWHIKDMDKVSRDYSELGNGSIDFTVILPEASRAGLQYYIEQGGNFAKDPMQVIQIAPPIFKVFGEIPWLKSSLKTLICRGLSAKEVINQF
jgi:sugar phosphate isomerase/epimerase